jgi:hypothetical protein
MEGSQLEVGANEAETNHHGLDFTFMEDWLWEGAASHPNSRLWPEGEPGGDRRRAPRGGDPG